MSDIITVRDGDIIAAEINVIKEHAAKVVISSAIEIGKRLVEAKAMVEHGQWGKWLAKKVDYSQSTANNMMKLYQEYGTGEVNLFDNWTNSEAFGKLSYTQHLALLALPFGERAEFAEQHQVADMSTRELEKAIRERDTAYADRDTAAADRDANLREVERLTAENNRITVGMAAAAEKLEAKDAEVERLQAQVNAAQDKQTAAEKKVETLKKKLDAATRAEAEARTELSQAKANPEISESLMEQLRAEVAAEAASKATEEIQKQLTAAQEEVARAEKAKMEAEEKAAAAVKAAQMSSPDMALFNAHLTQAQDQFGKMLDALKKIKAADPATAEKLKSGIREKLLVNLSTQLGAV